jgi:hypothetical protein
MVAAPMLATTSYAQGNSRNNPGCAHWKQDGKFLKKEEKKGQCGKSKKDDGGVVVTPAASGSTVTGTVFSDANFSGFQEPGELGAGAWTVTLTGATSAQNVTADATSGVYQFTNVAVGDYTVCVTPVGDGQYQTMPGGGAVCPVGYGWSVSVTVNGSVINAVDFGFGYWMP